MSVHRVSAYYVIVSILQHRKMAVSQLFSTQFRGNFTDFLVKNFHCILYTGTEIFFLNCL